MSEADPIRVLVVDDQDLVRGGFKAILGTYEGIEIVGEARNGADAVQEAQRLRPDVVLMDIRMPEMNGIEATRAITSNPLLAKTRVLVLTTFDVDEYVYDALGAGASGFLLKDADPDEIVAAIRVVARGDAHEGAQSVSAGLVHLMGVHRRPLGLAQGATLRCAQVGTVTA